MGLEALIPILIKYVIIPEVARVVRGNPGLTDAEILDKLPADLQGLLTKDQKFLDTIRGAAAVGR